ncbi:MAG: YihY/virulence factor BrkB family protein [Bradymonadaceae bacterium]
MKRIVEVVSSALKAVFSLLWDAARGYASAHGTHYAAAMAFYMIFSIAPLALIATAVTGLVYGRAAAEAEIIARAEKLLGPNVADVVGRLIDNWKDREAGVLATLVGAVVSIYFAFRVFFALRDTLNTLWSVRLRGDLGLRGYVRTYGRSFLAMFIVVPLLLASLTFSEVLTRITPYLEQWVGTWANWGATAYMAISFVMLIGMFAFIYKWLPDVDIAWQDVLVGSFVTAVFFAIGRSMIALYFINTTTTSVFGAAGSLVVVLFWVYYSAQIIFFGAEITEVYAARYGNGIEPNDAAVRVDLPGA